MFDRPLVFVLLKFYTTTDLIDKYLPALCIYRSMSLVSRCILLLFGSGSSRFGTIGAYGAMPMVPTELCIIKYGKIASTKIKPNSLMT